MTTNTDLVPEVILTLTSGRELILTGRDARSVPERPFLLQRTATGRDVLCIDISSGASNSGPALIRRYAMFGPGSLEYIEESYADAVEAGAREADVRMLIFRTLITFGSVVTEESE